MKGFKTKIWNFQRERNPGTDDFELEKQPACLDFRGAECGGLHAVPCVASRRFPVMGAPTPESSRRYSPRRCVTFNHTTVSLSPG